MRSDAGLSGELIDSGSKATFLFTKNSCVWPFFLLFRCVAARREEVMMITVSEASFIGWMAGDNGIVTGRRSEIIVKLLGANTSCNNSHDKNGFSPPFLLRSFCVNVNLPFFTLNGRVILLIWGWVVNIGNCGHSF